MKRDWDCIRAILQALEAKEDTRGVTHPNTIVGWSQEVVSYHMHLLNQAGLIEAVCHEHRNAPVMCMARMMTWEGHELLDKLNSDTLWNRVKAYARDKSIELSFEAITVLARKGVEGLL